MIHKVEYNWQGNNLNFKKKFSAWWQCFSTSAWMLMSFLCKAFDGTDDKALAVYLDDVEASIGKPGIAEKVIAKAKWIVGHTSTWWLVQKGGIETWLHKQGLKGEAVFHDRNIPFNSLRGLIAKSPVILQTKKLGGLSGGHIILAIGFTVDGIICHDPAGDAKTNYKSASGNAVEYPDKFLMKATGTKIRCMYWRPV